VREGVAQVLGRRSDVTVRFVRFAASGVVVTGVYALAMVALVEMVELPGQIALAGAYGVALAVHFIVNRWWVFSRGGYALGLSAHGTRYVCLAVTVYAVSALSLATLPDLLGISVLAAWTLTTGTIGLCNFVVLGRFVFR